MVVHCGRSMDTGHYYCFQLVRQRWYMLNDARVTPETWMDLQSIARGDKPTHCPTVLFYQGSDYAQPGDATVSSPGPRLEDSDASSSVGPRDSTLDRPAKPRWCLFARLCAD